MKKVDFKEAAKVVGGCNTGFCTLKYVQDGTDCYAATTCLDKNGNVVSTAKDSVPGVNCGITS